MDIIMNNKLCKFSGKNIIALLTLTGFCLSSPIVMSKKANAGIFGRVGSGVQRVFSRVFKTNSSNLNNLGNRTQVTVGNNAQTGGVSNGAILSTNGVNNAVNQANSTGSTQGNNTTLTNSSASLSQRLSSLENHLQIEQQRGNHPFNKLVMVSGVLGSSMVVVGTVAGIVQQKNFMSLTEEQARTDQAVQADLNNKRDHFNNVEIPEAEKTIIEYYKTNYGIDITQ